MISLSGSPVFAAAPSAAEMQEGVAYATRFQNFENKTISILEDLSKVDSVSIDVFKKKINPERAREKGLKHLLEIKKRLDSANQELDSIPRPESSHPVIEELMEILAYTLPAIQKDASQMLHATKELLLAAIRGEGDIPSRVKKRSILSPL